MSVQEWRKRVERNRLACKEGDWQLPGTSSMTATRTRFGGNDRQTFRGTVEILSLLDDSWSVHSSSDEEELSADELDLKTKPEATHVLLEVDAVMAKLADNCLCTECKSPVEVELKTTCIATCIELTCKNEECGYIYYSNPPAQVKSASDDMREKTTDYAVNIL
jgi:hypothetical protein